MEQNLFNQSEQSKEVSIFNFEGKDIRTIIINNNIWFMASDVTKILEYSNGRDAISRYVNPKDVEKLDTPTKGGNQKITYINESGIYSLVLDSSMPRAKIFRNWITSEVLPSIRKTGFYSAIPKKELSIEEMTLLVIQNMQSKIADQQKQLEEQKPKVEFAEKIVNTGNGVSIGDFAKSIGWGQNKLFDWLRKNKYLMSNNIPYQSYIDNGYFKVIEWVLEKKNEAKFKTLITGKGQEYIIGKIK